MKEGREVERREGRKDEKKEISKGGGLGQRMKEDMNRVRRKEVNKEIKRGRK